MLNSERESVNLVAVRKVHHRVTEINPVEKSSGFTFFPLPLPIFRSESTPSLVTSEVMSARRTRFNNYGA